MAHTTSDGPTRHRAGAALPTGSALVAALLGVAGGAWLVSARLATADMRLGVLTGESTMSASSQMGAASPMPIGLGDFIGTWTVMMVAMMVPSVLPAVRVFDAQMRAVGRSRRATLLFAVGYLLVWSATGAAAYVVVQAIQVWLPIGNPTAIRGGALLLIVAGAYQLTPLKVACLRHCQMSRTVLVTQEFSLVQGRFGSLRAGLVHGMYCLGSSWPLMLVLLLLGMMNLAWMAAVAAIILIEKVLPGGDVVGKAVGWALVGAGIILVAAPHPLPALMSLSTWP